MTNFTIKRTWFIPLLLLSFFQSVAQIKVINSETLKPIPYVEIYFSSGDLLGMTDTEGNIDQAMMEMIKQSTSDKLSFNHISFENLTISKVKLLSLKTIKLTPKDYNLKEVFIKTSHKKNYKYLKLKGYFRSYQINNNRVKYYADGIVEYVLPTGPKDKMWNRILSNRSFVNKELKEKKDL